MFESFHDQWFVLGRLWELKLESTPQISSRDWVPPGWSSIWSSDQQHHVACDIAGWDGRRKRRKVWPQQVDGWVSGIAEIISTFSRRGWSCFFSVCSRWWCPTLFLFSPLLGEIIALEDHILQLPRELKFSRKSPWAHLNTHFEITTCNVSSRKWVLPSFKSPHSVTQIIPGCWFASEN